MLKRERQPQLLQPGLLPRKNKSASSFLIDYYFDKLFLDRILSKLDIELTSDKSDLDYEELLNTAGALA